MSRRRISSSSPFESAYGYSRAVIDGDFCFIAGTTGYDYATMAMPEAPADQARNIFKTIDNVLTEAGFALADLVRLTIYVTDRAYAEPVLQICGEAMRDVRPAAAIIVVAGLLRAEMKVEIEATAKRG